MVQLIRGLEVRGHVRTNLAARARGDRYSGGSQPDATRREIDVLAACKYMPIEELHDTGRGWYRTPRREPSARPSSRRSPPTETCSKWDFIGAPAKQKKHVRAIVPHVRLIHSLASDSALRELERHPVNGHAPGPEECWSRSTLPANPAKEGIVPEQLDAFIARSPFPVAGLMTMPPLRRGCRGQPSLVRGAACAGG